MAFNHRNTLNYNDNQLWTNISKNIDTSKKMIDYSNNLSAFHGKTNTNSKITDYVVNGVGVKNKNLNFNNVSSSFANKIKYYRAISVYPEISDAIDIISNEMCSIGLDGRVVTMNLSKLGKKRISEDLEEYMNDIFDDTFTNIYDIKERLNDDIAAWMVDGEAYYEIRINEDIKDIIEIRHIDPMNITPFFNEGEPVLYVEMVDSDAIRDEDLEYINANIEMILDMKLRNLNKMESDDDSRRYLDYVKIYKPEQIIWIPFKNVTKKDDVVSYLENVRQPYNTLITLEAYLKIYRITRSKLQTAIHLDTGNMSQTKKEELLDQYINDYENDIYFDPNTSEIDVNKAITTATKTWWFVQGGDITGSKIESIDHSPKFNDIDDILYSERKFLRSLKIPLHRWKSVGTDNQTQVNNSLNESILTEELSFIDFTNNLKTKFTKFFRQIMEVRLTLHGIKPNAIAKSNFRYSWNENSFWSEYIQKTIMQNRLDVMKNLPDHFPVEWGLKNVMKMNESEWREYVGYYQRENGVLKNMYDGEILSKDQLKAVGIGADPAVNNTTKPKNKYGNGVDKTKTRNKKSYNDTIKAIQYFKKVLNRAKSKEASIIKNNLKSSGRI